MKNFITLIIFTLFSVSAFAQISVEGTITNTEGEPISGATIAYTNQDTGLRDGSISDIDGNFRFKLTKTGTYQLSVSYLGMYSLDLKKEFNEEKTYNLGTLQLQENVDELQTVEILGRLRKDYNSDYSFSATKVAIKNKELPQAITTVTKELIDDRLAFQLPDAVRTVSNVSATGLYNHYNIRGITQGDDGQILNGMRTRQYYFLQPITSHLERVEVIKGPSSVTFSSADPGGTVNMVTKKPLAEKRSSVSLTAGSFGTLRATADFTGPLNESKTLLYRFNAAVQDADSFRDIVNNNAILITPSLSYIPDENTSLNVELIYSDANGNLDRGQPIFDAVGDNFDPNSTPITLNPGAINDFYKTKEVIFMTSFSKKFTENFGFNAQYMKQTWDEDLQEHRADAFRQAYDVDGNVVPNLIAMRYAERQQNWDTDNFSGFFDYTIKTDKITNKILVGYDATRWKRNIGGANSARDYLLNDGTSARFRPGTSDPNDFQQTEDGLLVPVIPHLDLNNPFNGIRNTNNYVIRQFEIPANLTSSSGIYLQNQFKIGKLSALFNLRYEWFSDIFDFEGDEEEFKTNAFVPRLGLTYEVTDAISAYGTYLEGFQPHTNTVSLNPTAEGFFWSASPGRFDPLESSLIEVGAKGEFLNGRVFANVAIFEITQKNILLGDTFDLDNLTTRGEQRSKGFEADISGYILPNLQVTASYGYNDAIIEEDAIEEFIGERIGGAPEHNFNLWGRFDFDTNSTLNGIGVGLGAQYVDERFTWYNPTYSTNRVLLPSYTVFEAAVYYKPNIISGMQLTLKLNNIFDETYWLGGLNPNRLGPGAPRNVLLNATYNF